MLIDDCQLSLLRQCYAYNIVGVYVEDFKSPSCVGYFESVGTYTEGFDGIESFGYVPGDTLAGSQYFIYEQANRAYISVKDVTWGPSVMLTEGVRPRISTFEDKLSVLVRSTDNVIELLMLPSEIAYSPLGVQLWSCTTVSCKSAGVYQGHWTSCTGSKGDVRKQIDGNYASFNYDERGVVPVVTISWGAGKASVTWSDVTVDGWNRTYLVYLNDVLVSEQTSTSWLTDEVTTNDKIYVRVKIWKRFDSFGDVVLIGCASNELIYDEVKIARMDAYSVDSETSGVPTYVNFQISTPSSSDSTMSTSSSVMSEGVHFVHFYTRETFHSENSNRHDSFVNKDIDYVSFFPSQLM